MGWDQKVSKGGGGGAQKGEGQKVLVCRKNK